VREESGMMRSVKGGEGNGGMEVGRALIRYVRTVTERTVLRGN
jgi:hypothetical protein